MKKLLKTLLLLIILYFALKLCIKYWGQGHEISYKIDEITINEKLSINQKNEIDNYLITLKDNDFNIQLQILDNFNKDTKIVKKVYVEKINNQICLLPIFKNNKIITDIMCINDNIITNYNNLKGSIHELDNFASRMTEHGYDFKQYENNLKNYDSDRTVILYRDNIIKDHFIGLNDYRGVMIINNKDQKLNSINLFTKDIYDVSLAIGLNNKYIIFDYNSKYQFNKIYIVDLVNNKKKELKTNYKISNDSKIIGSYKDSIYVIDYDDKVEYEINLKKETVKEIGDKDKGYLTSNCKELVEIDGSDIFKQNYKMPDCREVQKTSKYDKIDLIGGQKSGYYYYYQKTIDGYKVYRANVLAPEQKLYITTLDDLDHIQYSNKFIYYLKDNQINYYSDATGIRTLLENSEFEFNKSLNYHLYVNEK